MKIFFRNIVFWSLLILMCPLLFTVGKSISGAGSYHPNAEWAGVLRIWTCASKPFGTGSPASWLSARAEAFEKKHPGVRIQFTEIPREALSSFTTATYPPDAILFSPGSLPSAENLIPLDPPANLRPELADSGRAGNEITALPVTMNGYFWLCADSILKTPPGSPDCPSNLTFHMSPDSSDTSYSAALLALFTGEIPARVEPHTPGTDLGLPQTDSPDVPHADRIPIQKPASFAPDLYTSSARSLFASGDTDAFIGTAQDIRRLEQLADSGKAPEYSVFSGGTAFTDLLAMAAVIDQQGADPSPQERLCADFITFLLTEESQSSLKATRAFRVTEGEPLYSASRNGMAEAEAALSGDLIVPNAFDSSWRARAAQAADLFIHTDAAASDLFRTIFPQ